MADEPQTLRYINWRELFPFIHLFRAFRIAIHPSKLFLGLLLVLSLYAGGRVLDALWSSRQYPSAGEIDAYTQYKWGQERGKTFDTVREDKRLSNAQMYAGALESTKIVADHQAALDAAYRGHFYRRLQDSVIHDRNEAISNADKEFGEGISKISDPDRQIKIRELGDQHDSKIRSAQLEALANLSRLHDVAPQPIFDEFLNYEAKQFHYVVESALAGNWMGGVSNARVSEAAAFTRGNPLSENAMPMLVSTGPVSVIYSVSNFTVVGPGWLIQYHLFYFALYICWFLLMWAIFGGAIARIAAVHVSRDEKISVRQALRFSSSKVLSFIFAPIIPLIIILIAGAVVAAGGLLMYIPVLGPIAVGALFILALVAGFVMTLVVAGTAGGFNLMYPTVAVEGSDSFDAISRSFSYVFARPWRMLLYTAVSLIYGAITFTFCRLFIYVMLLLTQFFAGWWLVGKAGRYWPEIWPPVTEANLAYHLAFPSLAWSEKIAAVLISMWIYIVLGLLAGFVISFYFSANTIIYILIRREVDATEMDDVYLEETDDDFSDAAVAGTAPRIETVTTQDATVSVITTPTSPPIGG